MLNTLHLHSGNLETYTDRFIITVVINVFIPTRFNQQSNSSTSSGPSLQHQVSIQTQPVIQNSLKNIHNQQLPQLESPIRPRQLKLLLNVH